MRRKIDEFGLLQESPEFFFAQREIHGGFRKFLPLQPRCIIVQRICGFAVGLMKGDAKLFVLEGTDGGNEILLQEICGTLCDLDGEFHIGFGNDFIEVCPRRDEDIWDLRFDRDQAANAILERRKIPLDVNIYIGSARINHGIPFEYRHLLHFKEVLLDCSLENSQIDGLAGTEFGSIELVQPIVEAPQPRKFGVEREAAVVSDFTIIFMKPESGPLQGVSA